VKQINYLILGDTHCPFDLDEYLQFCIDLKKKYRCNRIIHIGDEIDANSWSVHDSNPDGYSPGMELEYAITRLQRYYLAFPTVTCIMGNHSYRVQRKAIKAGLSTKFLKDYKDIIQAPAGWNFVHDLVENNILFTHGTGNAFKRMKDERTNLCQGHLHSESSIQWSSSRNETLWSMQVGCGVDDSKYAFAYGRDMAKRPIISAGIILGNTPILEVLQ